MCSNVSKFSDYAKKSYVSKNKNICFINQDLVGFEPTGKCPIDVLVKTQLGLNSWCSRDITFDDIVAKTVIFGQLAKWHYHNV